MNKALEAFEKLKNKPTLTTDWYKRKTAYDYNKAEYDIIETALKEKEEQDNIINIIKETIEFNIQEPKMEIKENGEISLLSAIGMSLRKNLNKKEKEFFREWVLKECFPEELKALEIVKECKEVICLRKEYDEELYTPEEIEKEGGQKYYLTDGSDGYRRYEITKEEFDLLKEVLS